MEKTKQIEVLAGLYQRLKEATTVEHNLIRRLQEDSSFSQALAIAQAYKERIWNLVNLLEKAVFEMP